MCRFLSSSGPIGADPTSNTIESMLRPRVRSTTSFAWPVMPPNTFGRPSEIGISTPFSVRFTSILPWRGKPFKSTGKSLVSNEKRLVPTPGAGSLTCSSPCQSVMLIPGPTSSTRTDPVVSSVLVLGSMRIRTSGSGTMRSPLRLRSPSVTSVSDAEPWPRRKQPAALW